MRGIATHTQVQRSPLVISVLYEVVASPYLHVVIQCSVKCEISASRMGASLPVAGLTVFLVQAMYTNTAVAGAMEGAGKAMKAMNKV